MSDSELLSALFTGETVESLMRALGFTLSESTFFLENFND